MKRIIDHPQNRLYLLAALTLLAGLGSSATIYLTAEDAADDMTIYAFENSKAYRHDLELYGGKVNVLANDFLSWFNTLWHGKTLAFTVAVITLITAAVLFFIAYYLLYDETPDGRTERREK